MLKSCSHFSSTFISNDLFESESYSSDQRSFYSTQVAPQFRPWREATQHRWQQPVSKPLLSSAGWPSTWAPSFQPTLPRLWKLQLRLLRVPPEPVRQRGRGFLHGPGWVQGLWTRDGQRTTAVSAKHGGCISEWNCPKPLVLVGGYFPLKYGQLEVWQVDTRTPTSPRNRSHGSTCLDPRLPGLNPELHSSAAVSP